LNCPLQDFIVIIYFLCLLSVEPRTYSTGSSLFAEKYKDLYTSVPYDVEDMTALYEELHNSTVEDGFDSNCTVSFHEVTSAVHRLKSGKSDGCIGHSSYYFLNACDELLFIFFFTFFLHF